MAPALTSCWRFSSTRSVSPALFVCGANDLTGVCHVQKSTSGVSLNAHVSGLGQPRKWAKSTRPRNLGLILLVGCEVCDAAHCIALDLDVG